MHRVPFPPLPFHHFHSRDRPERCQKYPNPCGNGGNISERTGKRRHRQRAFVLQRSQSRPSPSTLNGHLAIVVASYRYRRRSSHCDTYVWIIFLPYPCAVSCFSSLFFVCCCCHHLSHESLLGSKWVGFGWSAASQPTSQSELAFCTTQWSLFCC